MSKKSEIKKKIKNLKNGEMFFINANINSSLIACKLFSDEEIEKICNRSSLGNISQNFPNIRHHNKEKVAKLDFPNEKDYIKRYQYFILLKKPEEIFLNKSQPFLKLKIYSENKIGNIILTYSDFCFNITKTKNKIRSNLHLIKVYNKTEMQNLKELYIKWLSPNAIFLDDCGNTLDGDSENGIELMLFKAGLLLESAVKKDRKDIVLFLINTQRKDVKSLMKTTELARKNKYNIIANYFYEKI